MSNTPKPDYAFWSKLDKWTYQEAALLLNQLEPLLYKQVHFSSKAVPSETELTNAYKTFLLLKNIDLNQEKSNTHIKPASVYRITCLKHLSIPEDLANLLAARQKLELATADENQQAFTVRERRTLLKSIALMAILLSEDSKRQSKFKIAERLNISSIGEAIRQIAELQGLSIEGLKRIELKIKEGLAILAENE